MSNIYSSYKHTIIVEARRVPEARYLDEEYRPHIVIQGENSSRPLGVNASSSVSSSGKAEESQRRVWYCNCGSDSWFADPVRVSAIYRARLSYS